MSRGVGVRSLVEYYKVFQLFGVVQKLSSFATFQPDYQTMATLPIDIIPQIISFLPASCLHKFTLIPHFLLPAQRKLFDEIELSSFFHCSSLASLLRDTESSHLASYVLRMHILPSEDAALKATGDKPWFDDAQEFLAELLDKFVLLEELDVNFRTSGIYGFLDWESRLSQKLQDAVTRTLSLPSLTTFRIHRASFIHGSTIDALFANFSDKHMKMITLDNVDIKNSESTVLATPYRFPPALQPSVVVEHLHLNFDIVNPQILLWLLQPQCTVTFSTIRRLGLVKFMSHEDKVTELFAKATSLHVLELFIYKEHFNDTLLPLISPPSLHTLVFHFSYQIDTIYDIIKRLESSIPTLNSVNSIERIIITYIITSNSAPGNTIGSKDLWRRLGCYITTHDRLPRLKKFDFILIWADVAKLGNEAQILESGLHCEVAEQYARTVAGFMKEDEERDGSPVVSVRLSNDIPEVWLRVHDYPWK